MSDAQPSSEGATDVAALSASVIAVSLSLYVTPGEFGIVNLLISFTLLSIIFGYVWPNRRRRAKSFALSTIIALASVPAVGFLDEGIRSHYPIEFLLANYEWQCSGYNHDPCKDGKEHISRVSDFDVAITWLLIVIIAFNVDSRAQAKRP